MSDHLDAIESAIGDLAEAAARDLDHHGCHHGKWYSAVKKARKALARLLALENRDQAWAEIRDTMADTLLNAKQKETFVKSILSGVLAIPQPSSPSQGREP